MVVDCCSKNACMSTTSVRHLLDLHEVTLNVYVRSDPKEGGGMKSFGGGAKLQSSAFFMSKIFIRRILNLTS